MKPDILRSWRSNAKEWNTIIENGEIPSRRYTNEAILKVIDKIGPKKLADLGCGEGWLTREMTKVGIEAHGFDATEELIAFAQKKGGEAYHLLDFAHIIQGVQLPNAPFEMAVFNFSLYQKNDVRPLLANTLNSLTPSGVLLIQTLHPNFLLENELEYRSQWISDSWKGLPGNFKDGHAWYARTLEDWVELISNIGHTTFVTKEIHASENKPLSLIIQIYKQNGEV